jgi:hypothetical protein
VRNQASSTYEETDVRRITVGILTLALCIFGFFGTANECSATKFAQPKRKDVFSPNGHFVLDVDPNKDSVTVYAVEDRKAPLWSFSERLWHTPFFVSNDGDVIVKVAWQFVQQDELGRSNCIEFRSRDGLFRAYTFAEVCHNPAKTNNDGPIGEFWRTWYRDPASSLRQSGDALFLSTTDGMTHRFSLRTGALLSSRPTIIDMLVPSSRAGVIFCIICLGLLLVTVWIFGVRHRKRRSVAAAHPD